MDCHHKKSYNCHIVVIIISSISVIIWHSIIIHILLLLLLLLLSLILLFIIYYQNQPMDSNYSNSFLFCYPNIFCLLKKFRKGVSYPTFFAPCEIMCLTNGLMEFKKEFCLLQTLAILVDSAPIYFRVFYRIFQAF